MALFDGLGGWSALRSSNVPGQNIVGSNSNDVLLGDMFADTITALAGDDFVLGQAGNDLIDGGANNDVLLGASDDDTLRGRIGDDQLYGATGFDSVLGGAGRDTIFGGTNDDTLHGGSGADLILGGMGADEIFGGVDDDTLRGGAGNDTFTTGMGDDIIDGERDDDTVLYTGSIFDFSIDVTGGVITVTDLVGAQGTDQLTSIETLIFADATFQPGVSTAPLVSVTDITTDEDSTVDFTVEVLAFDGETVSVTDISSTGAGAFIATGSSAIPSPVTGTGTAFGFTFDPEDQFQHLSPNLGGLSAVTDLISVEVTDAGGDVVEESFDVTVTGVNDPPTAQDDSATVAEDGSTSISVLDNDGDVDLGDSIRLVSVTNGTLGTAMASASGTITYRPNPNVFGMDSFTYTIEDSTGAQSTAMVDVTITAVNDLPMAVNDTGSTAEDTPLTIDVQANDSDADAVTLTTVAASDGANGSTAVNGNGSVTYTPDLNFFGDDSFTYTIDDGDGAQATATVNVTVTAVNDPPEIDDIDASTDEDNAVTIAVLSGASDPEGDGISVTLAGAATDGQTLLNSDGTITYTPDADFFGDDSFTYTVEDDTGAPSTATVNVTVNAVNDDPVVTFLQVSELEENGPFTIDLGAQVSDPEGGVVTISDIQPARGDSSPPFTETSPGVIEIDPEDNTLDTGEELVFTLDYTATDDGGASVPGAVEVTITGFTPAPPTPPTPPSAADNIAPTADPFAKTLEEEELGSVRFDLAEFTSDPDEGDELTITALTLTYPTGGGATTTFPLFSSLFSTDTSSAGDAEERILTVDLSFLSGFVAPGETLQATLDYTVADLQNATATETITLTVNGDNTPPVAEGLPVGGGGGADVPPTVVIIDDPMITTQTVDLDTLISDAETADADLDLTVSGVVFGFAAGDDGVDTSTTVPVSFDAATNIVTIDLTAIAGVVGDGENAIGTITYTVSDGIDSATAAITYDYTNPLDLVAPGAAPVTYDFEDVSNSGGATSEIMALDDFILLGAAEVIETDELSGGGGRETNTLADSQTTPGGDNVLLAAPATTTTVTPVIDSGTGLPLRDPDTGLPQVTEETVVDALFAISAPGSSRALMEYSAANSNQITLGFTVPGLTDPGDFSTLDDLGTPFDLGGFAVNAASGDGVEVTMTLYYDIDIIETNFSSSFSSYVADLTPADSFVFTLDASTPPTVFDFDSAALPDGTPIADNTVFDAIYGVTFETDDMSALIFDDLILTG